MGRNNCGWKVEGECCNPEAMYLGRQCPWKYGISCGHYNVDGHPPSAPVVAKVEEKKIKGGETKMAKVEKPTQAAYQGYCLKCKAKKDMGKAQVVTMKNKRKAVKGVCPDCGTKMFKILGKGK